MFEVLLNHLKTVFKPFFNFTCIFIKAYHYKEIYIMPFKPLDFIKKKKQSERPEPSIPIIILSAVDADDNW